MGLHIGSRNPLEHVYRVVEQELPFLLGEAQKIILQAKLRRPPQPQDVLLRALRKIGGRPRGFEACAVMSYRQIEHLAVCEILAAARAICDDLGRFERSRELDRAFVFDVVARHHALLLGVATKYAALYGPRSPKLDCGDIFQEALTRLVQAWKGGVRCLPQDLPTDEKNVLRWIFGAMKLVTREHCRKRTTEERHQGRKHADWRTLIAESQTRDSPEESEWREHLREALAAIVAPSDLEFALWYATSGATKSEAQRKRFHRLRPEIEAAFREIGVTSRRSYRKVRRYYDLPDLAAGRQAIASLYAREADAARALGIDPERVRYARVKRHPQLALAYG